MRIVEMQALDNGAHWNQTIDGAIPVPEGWAIIPDDMVCENFPFGEVEAEERFETREPEDGTEETVSIGWYVTKWTPGTIPEPEEEVKTPAQQREDAYNTEAMIAWDGEMITVTQASQLWQYYAAEGSDKASELQALIAAAKAEIREKYPD